MSNSDDKCLGYECLMRSFKIMGLIVLLIWAFTIFLIVGASGAILSDKLSEETSARHTPQDIVILQNKDKRSLSRPPFIAGVLDAKTVYITVSKGKSEKIELYGLDSPKIDGAKCQDEALVGMAARDFISYMLDESAVTKIKCRVNSSGEFVYNSQGLKTCLIITDTLNLNSLLIDMKLAYPSNPNFKSHNWCGGRL